MNRYEQIQQRIKNSDDRDIELFDIAMEIFTHLEDREPNLNNDKDLLAVSIIHETLKFLN